MKKVRIIFLSDNYYETVEIPKIDFTMNPWGITFIYEGKTTHIPWHNVDYIEEFIEQ